MRQDYLDYLSQVQIPLSLFLSLRGFLALSHTQTHTHTLRARARTHTLSPSLSHTHTHTHTHTHILTLSLAQHNCLDLEAGILTADGALQRVFIGT